MRLLIQRIRSSTQHQWPSRPISEYKSSVNLIMNYKHCSIRSIIQQLSRKITHRSKKKAWNILLAYKSECESKRFTFYRGKYQSRRSQRPRGLRRRSVAARLLRLWVRILPRAWIFVCCECCVLSGRSLCDELITRPAESYRLWCVVVCDLETSWVRRSWPTGGLSHQKKVLVSERCTDQYVAVWINDGLQNCSVSR